MKLRSGLTAAALVAAALHVQAAPEARVIVAFKEGSVLARQAQLGEHAAARGADLLAASAGVPLRAGHRLGPRLRALRADGAPGLDSAALARRLAAHPDVDWAVPDRRRRALAAPNDPLYAEQSRWRGPDAGQWALRPPDATYRSAANLESAWDRVDRAALGAVVVAIIDTGVLPDHPDLAGVLLPGSDFIHDADYANDGDGRDADASDPGDWITGIEDQERGGKFEGCGASSSSWHGTLVATIAGAAANDGIGMAGAAHGVRLLPVRVLGKCGGFDSDIIAGMLWAAGVEPAAGAPGANPNPARVLNLSLGGTGSCSNPYIDAVRRINAAGAVVVAAAGNGVGGPVGTPANCAGAIGVGGLRHAGSKVGFSDLGSQIALSAPGGNCVNIDGIEPCLYPIVAGTNGGSEQPWPAAYTWTDSFNISVGTSFAAPIVSGAAALLLAQRPTLTPSQLRQLLQRGTRPFPQTGADNGPSDPTPVLACRPPAGEQLQCYCPNDGSLCGTGMLDADASLALSETGFASINVDTFGPTAGRSVQLSVGEALAPLGRERGGQFWTLVDGGGVVAGFDGARNLAQVAFTASGAGNVTVRLTLTDAFGAALVSSDLSVAVAAAPVSPPGSGGGASGLPGLLALLLAAALLRRR